MNRDLFLSDQPPPCDPAPSEIAGAGTDPDLVALEAEVAEFGGVEVARREGAERRG